MRTPTSCMLLLEPLHDLANEPTCLRETYTELFVMHQVHLQCTKCICGPTYVAVARAPLAMTGLVQYQPNAKNANKEVEDIKIAMALCTQRAHLKPLCFSVCSTYS